MFMGTSKGRMDIYDAYLEGQFLDVTTIPNGVYWLESEVNTNGSLLETSDSDNRNRIKVQVISSQDYYEVNEDQGDVDEMAPGVTNARFARCQLPVLVNGLSIHQDFDGILFNPDDDWFRFDLIVDGTSSDFVRIDFDQSLGDLDLVLQSASGGYCDSSHADADNMEYVPLDSVAAGSYYVHVYADTLDSENPPVFQFHTLWDYDLTIQAPGLDLCGDVSDNGSVSVADILLFNANCFYNTIACTDVADVDGNCPLNCVADLLYLIAYVFRGGPAPDCTCQ